VLVQAGETLHVAAALPLTAATKPTVPLRTIGRVVQAVGDTIVQINTVRGSSGKSSPPSAGSPSGGVPPSDTGSNETKPPAGKDDEPEQGPSAPPGDVLP
jgi:hypothetical protein